MITIIAIGLMWVCVLLLYIIWNLSAKNKVYEESIEQFYSALAVTLTTMRMIDEKQMFETDDEVGTVFQQLVDIMGNLRPILYGMENDENKEN